MSSPGEFIRRVRSMLHDAEIDFAITSGQAFDYFGIQQTTGLAFFESTLLVNAARNYGLPECPFTDLARQRALQDARSEAAEIFAASHDELDEIMPPAEVMLP